MRNPLRRSKLPACGQGYAVGNRVRRASSRDWRRSACNYPNTTRPDARLKQSLLPPQVPKDPNIGEREVEAKLILIAHRAQGETTIFNTNPAAIPVVCCLN